MQQGVTIIRPGQRLIMPGAQIMQTRASGGGWWNNSGAIAGCVAAYAPKGAASLAASYTNLANPGTNDAAPGVSPAWDAMNGWKFTTLQYLDSSVVLGSGYSLIVRFSNLTTNTAAICGVNGGAGRIVEIWPLDSAGTRVSYSNGAGYISVSPGLSSGVLAVAGNRGYRNGVQESPTMSAWSGINAASLYINGTNGSPSYRSSVYIQAVAIYSLTLTSGEVSTLTTLMNAL